MRGTFLKLGSTVILILFAVCAAMAQRHAPPPTTPNRTGMTNVGEVLLPLPIGAQYSAAIDSSAGFGYFGPSHHPAISKIDLRGHLPKIVATPTDVAVVGRVSAILVDTTDRDPLKHYLYVSGDNVILKMTPGDDTHAPEVVATLRPTSVSRGLLAGAIDTTDPDPARHYAYYEVNVRNQPPKVLRVRLSDFSDQGAETLKMNNVRFTAIDTVHHYAYFTSSPNLKQNQPLQFCKVNLATFHDGGESVATYSIDSTTLGDGVVRDGTSYLFVDVGFVIDKVHGYAYLGTANAEPGPNNDKWPNNQSMVIQVKLGDGDSFPDHPLKTLDLRVGERDLSAAVIDMAHGNVYFGTDNTYPAHVYMIHVGDGKKPMREVGRLDLNLGSKPLIDLPHDGDTVPGAAADLYGEVYLRSAILYAKGNAIYWGTDSRPSQIIKVGINGKK